MNRAMTLVGVVAMGMLCASGLASAGIVVTGVSFGGSYTQNFDGLPQSGSETVTGRGPHNFSALTTVTASGMEGWQFANPAGSSANTEFRAQNGSLSGSAGRGVVSFGTDGASDRALGALPTSNQINAFGVVLINNAGGVVDTLNVAFVGEQWRRGDISTPSVLGLTYGFGGSIDDAATAVESLKFLSPNQAGATNSAVDGNAVENQSAIAGVLTGLNWQPGSGLALKWTMSEQSGQDDGLAIDSLSISGRAIPEPATLGVLACLGLVALRRR